MTGSAVREALHRLHAQPTVSVDDFAVLIGIGRSTAYSAIASGEVPSIRIGRRVRIPSRWLREQLALGQPSADHGSLPDADGHGD
ncbi:helix-turn-helix domain-containing protein [Nocardia puris]|uniref:helix-turn-helix domain-containing protein n=1 Tax=Nocardia puris TaxID=208602 RepID=UPI0018934990|nr:helix-turn-helix domain-containing protein [Nocardia puris]